MCQNYNKNKCKMQARNYTFSYLRRYSTSELLKKYTHILDKDDLREYINKIGEWVYEFGIEDPYSQWRVMKTHREVDKFAALRNTFLKIQYSTKKFQSADQLGDKKMGIVIKDVYPGQPPPEPIIKFFQIYNLNIDKITLFLMHKKTRGLKCLKKCQNWCFGAEWTDKRIIITREGILEMANDGSVTDFLKFDLYFSLRSGMAATMHEFGIALTSAQRKIVLKARDVNQFLFFLFYTSRALEHNTQKINYLGSCRRSQNNNIDYFVDAQDYYESVAHGMQSATRDIMICGWWISPQLYLIRPLNDLNKYKQPDYWRLDKIIQRKANLGVKVKIVVFFAPSIIPNNSDYTKRALTSLHSTNITVERHPHQILPKLWSHHQKVVVIDQKMAFMGGLDLCYGRYDSHQHPISQNDKQLYPGIDYNNVRIKDFIDVDKYDQQLQDRKLPRMPWHDVAFKVTGKIVGDVANHFVEYWNFTVLEKKIAPLATRNIISPDTKSERENLETATNINSSQKDKPNQFLNAIFKMALSAKDKETIDYYMESKPRMEKMTQVFRAEWLKNKKIELYNGPGEEGLVLSIESLGLLKQDRATRENQRAQARDQLQLLRSASEWSIGLEQGVTERSIQNAYLSAIKNAQHFIYIENQFFISATGDHKNSFVQNQIANALYERIEKAAKKKQKFRVVVFMPLLPGMQGQLTQKCPMALKLTMYWQYNTISQSPHSLLARVAKLKETYGVVPEDYIQFYALRTHGILDQQPVTQLIYIHTKLMIVDDHIVICGSANINDRSQEGDRDSELAVIFTSGKKASKRMNHTTYQINQKAHYLRCKLYQEHFAMSYDEAHDPLSPHTISLMRSIAQTNTLTYRQVFGCSPDDTVDKLAAVKNLEKRPNRELYDVKSKQIRGHAVQFPTKFLCEEKLYGYDLNKIQDIFT